MCKIRRAVTLAQFRTLLTDLDHCGYFVFMVYTCIILYIYMLPFINEKESLLSVALPCLSQVLMNEYE